MENKIERIINVGIAIFVLSIFSSYFYLIYTTPKQSVEASTPLTYYVEPQVPNLKTVSGILNKNGYQEINNPKIANIEISTTNAASLKDNGVIASNYYSIITDFKSQQLSLTTQTFEELMNSNSLYTDPDTHLLFPSTITTTLPAIDFIDQNPGKYYLLPADQINENEHEIAIDGNLIYTTNLLNYPLVVNWHIYSNRISDNLLKTLKDQFTTNFEQSAVHTIMMTGTTAFGRGEYFAIKAKGPLYPSMYVTSLFKGADIVHISNETSFDDTCTQQVGTLKFCAPNNALQTMKSIGVNLVEITGNHNNDFGNTYNLNTQKIYNQNGIKYFGGGANNQTSSNPTEFNLNGVKIAFLGYNEPGPSYAFATTNTAGAYKLDVNQMVNDIKKAKESNDLVFVDIQWENENNQYPDQFQISSAHAAIDAGANIVTGSQAHRPEGMESYNGGMIFYGLGNFFFDQMENLDTRQAVILKHFVYNGKIVQTQFTPTLLFNYSQPKPVVGDDASAIYNEIWQSSTNIY